MGTREKTVFVAQQLQFANTLAGNDPKLRARAMRRLRKYFLKRSSGDSSFTKDDFMRIWKGLFYCMWMSDKPLIQEELAEQISQLVHCFLVKGKNNSQKDAGIMFIESFFSTVMVEWFGIDHHRLEKFQMFFRRFLRHSFIYCKKKKWNKRTVHSLCEVFKSTLLFPELENNECGDMSLIIHFVDIFVEELAKVGEGALPKETLLQFLEPFSLHLAQQDDTRLQNTIRNNIFYCLIKQSPQGMDYEEKFEAWKRAGFPGRSWKDMVFVGKEDTRSGVKIKDLDPRAGKVDVYLPHLDFEAIDVADLLRRSAEESQTNYNKKFIKKIADKFQDLSQDNYPLALNISSLLTKMDKYRFSKEKIDDAAIDLLNFKEDLEKHSRELEGRSNNKKKKKKSSKSKKLNKRELDVQDSEDGSEDGSDSGAMSDESEETSLPNSRAQKKTSPNKINIGNNTFNRKRQLNDVVSDEDSNENEFKVDKKLARHMEKKKRMRNSFTWEVSEIPSIQKTDVGEEESAEVREDNEKTFPLDSSNQCIKQEIQSSTQNNEKIVSKANGMHDGDIDDLIAVKERKILIPLRRSTRVKPKTDCIESVEEKEQTFSAPASNAHVTRNTERVQTLRGKNTLLRGESLVPLRKKLSEKNCTKMSSDVSTSPVSEILLNVCPVRNTRANQTPDREIPSTPKRNEQLQKLDDSTEPPANLNKGTLEDSPGEDSSSSSSSNILSEDEEEIPILKKVSPEIFGKNTPLRRRNSVRTSTPGSSKKVNIALQMNRSQAVAEYVAAVRQSPSVPHDADKKPFKGVLKRTSIQSPINPFYVPPKGLRRIL